jgi:hypothetical protein
MPRRSGVRRVRTARPHELQQVARLDRRRPRTCDALVAVDDDVERELPALGVPRAHRVGADAGPLLARVARPHVLHVERRRVAGARRRQLQLDVVVGELADGEAVELVPADDDAHHVRGHALDALDGGVDRAALGPCGRLGH